ncbi:hypothetical protein FACS18948_3710 [Clostridia bacterium]|nr:hypothetical protein FACS18948_3710 [Clostridia bacterium]
MIIDRKQIAIESIKVFDFMRDDLRDMDEFTDSIRQCGMLDFLVVSDNEDGSYILIDGYRRLLAAQRLGWTAINATIMSPMTELERMRFHKELHDTCLPLTPEEVLEGESRLSAFRDSKTPNGSISNA